MTTEALPIDALPILSYTLRYDARPPTENWVHRAHRYQVSTFTAEYRGAFKGLARKAKIPALEAIGVSVQTRLRGKRSRDTAAEVSAAKAAIDGLVDARIIPDDTPDYVRWLRFDAPVLEADIDSLTLTLHVLAEASAAGEGTP